MEDVVVNIENEEVTNQADVNIIKETNGVTLEKEENVNYYPNNNVVFNEGIVNEKIIEDVNDIVIFWSIVTEDLEIKIKQCKGQAKGTII